MLDYRISFIHPGYLWLLLALPVLWLWSFRSLAGLGWWRRAVALTLRSLVALLLICALAEIQIVRVSDRLTTIYVLDQSRSIPEELRQRMAQYVNQSIAKHRHNRDRAGVIVFGGTAAIEIPPFDDRVQLGAELDGMRTIDPNYTDLSAAIKLAMASFPEDSAKRIVLVSDGNENRGRVADTAQAAADAGIGIDVVPIEYDYPQEVLVENVSLPPDVRQGQPVELRVVLNNTSVPKPGESGIVRGKLVVQQTTDGSTQPLNPDDEGQRVELPPGKSVFTLPLKIDRPNFYRFEARFLPDDPRQDQMVQNNEASTFTHVAGSARVLLIENDAPDARGVHDLFVDRLRSEKIEVTTRIGSLAFNSLAELQQYDSVILADVPKESLTEAQVEMLIRNTHDTGCGLVMLGGQNSFGAGGWANSKLEEAMPVDFHIKNAKIVPKGALALLMHASEMPDGNNLQKQVAKAAIEGLSGQDYCGLLHWNGTDDWLWKQQGQGMINVGPNRNLMLTRISRMTPGDMPQFDGAMVMARQGFAKLPDAAVKHMIIISDGDPSPPSNATLQALKNLKVTVTTVAIGSHGLLGSQVMQDIAKATQGKYYEVRNPNTLPKIYHTEARRISRPLIYENIANPFAPRVKYPSEIVRGVEEPFPPITGYVMTTVKENPLVEVSLVAPLPAGEATEANRTICAHWQFGIGRTVAFTTDVGQRWATQWTGWPGYNKFFTQLVRTSMRPAGDTGKFTVATQVEDGRVKVIVTALDKDDEFLNFESMAGTVIRPSGDNPSELVKIEQTAPGRYEGSFAADDAGSYVIAIAAGAGRAPLRTGINIPYSQEFRIRETDFSMLKQLATQTPRGGQPGAVIQSPNNTLDEYLKTDTFRRGLAQATSSQDAWYWLVLLASCIFFVDVFNRRVTIDLSWVGPLAARAWAYVRRQPAPVVRNEYMERLKSRKQEVNVKLDEQRTATRFEAPADVKTYSGTIETETGAAPPTAPVPKPAAGGLAPQTGGEAKSYTERLMEAKKKVWEEKNKKKE